MNEYEAKDHQIKQEWIQLKDMHPFTKFKWSEAMLMFELFRRSHENNQPS